MDKVRIRDNRPFYENFGRPSGTTIYLLLITVYWQPGLLWVRWLKAGPGFKIKNINKHPLLFSERNKYKGVQFGKWFFIKLKGL